ncbi:hypothetical protein D5041_10370 [Verminephrobacter aporrectodeae subsp. tuberculatae]|uniref:AAA family ATPase n=1 Tax=Verminephrobacter aporrectodeae TaxID=1110389 RepID=UPI002237A6F4|nr:AAA family ATPase [Verminephrobacter aporrectodeae]MCW5220161.1 hypothetical protein [Verminephrobacter aporrectodeae subsp. tuberculatae]MCW5289449.1 hypothetical protein [Verminephrobacter aporrectodeae subsp. tuberculatae]
MSIIQEIRQWSQTLQPWQQEAIARLYADRSLASADMEDLFALAKAEHGIEDSEKRVTSTLAAAQFAAPAVPNRVVQISAIKNLQNVNALVEGHRLPISASGLTIIYGENGAGKSGYSRVLKQACRARVRGEPILADMRKPPGQPAVATAIFEVMINGTVIDLRWTHGQEAPEQLSEIAIFDAHCARAYVDNEGDFAYVPYGLDILEGLVKTCVTVKGRATKELADNKPNTEPFAALSRTGTKVGAMLVGLSARTSPANVEALATLTDADTDRLAMLNRALTETDPKQKAQTLRLRASRFTSLATRIGTAIALVDDAKFAALRVLIEKSNVAKKAALLAAEAFKKTPGLLPGTGGEAWQALFETARTYAEESHAAHTFPHLPADSVCPLCQNTLGDDGSTRIAAFDAFIQQEAEKLAKSARATAAVAYKAIEQAKLDLVIDDALSKELADMRADLATACVAMQTALTDRQATVLKAAAGKVDWEDIAALPTDPSETLNAVSTKLQADAKALHDSMDDKAKAAMVQEQAELDARRRLAEIKSLVLNAIAKFVLCGKLKACADSISTTGISRKSTELSKTMATQEVADALNAELQCLNAHQLQVAMRPASPGGKMQFKLALELPRGGDNPSAILSEGEQRAIAIASFLAELKLGKGRGGIVLDDPVSSLDHARRERVASRLAQEAQNRQVIVLTHDLYFLNVLMQESRKLEAEPTCLTLRRGSQGFGVADLTLPFEGASTKDRVGQLRQLQVECEKLRKDNDDAGYQRVVRDLYSHLRMSWERAVEELLFNGVVMRFRKSVETNRLKKVVVSPEDIATIEQNMSKCSTFTGHDGAMEANPAMPEPSELSIDVEALETWRKAKNERIQK